MALYCYYWLRVNGQTLLFSSLSEIEDTNSKTTMCLVRCRNSLPREHLVWPPIFGEVHVDHLCGFLCCVFFYLSSSCVLRTQCCQCLWVVHSVFPRWYCVPNVASVSGLYIMYCPVGLVYPMLPVSLGCTFCISPSVLCTQCCRCLWVVHSALPRRSCVPNVASVSGLCILYCPVGFL